MCITLTANALGTAGMLCKSVIAELWCQFAAQCVWLCPSARVLYAPDPAHMWCLACVTLSPANCCPALPCPVLCCPALACPALAWPGLAWPCLQEVVCADPDCLGWVAPKHADGNVTATVCGRSDCQKPICVSVLRGRKTVQQPKAWYIEFRLDDVSIIAGAEGVAVGSAERVGHVGKRGEGKLGWWASIGRLVWRWVCGVHILGGGSISRCSMTHLRLYAACR